MIIKMILLLLWLVIIPLYVGVLFTKKQKEDNSSLIMAYLNGMIVLMALFQIIYIPMVFLEMSLGNLLIVWMSCVGLLACYSLIRNRTLKVYRSYFVKEIKSYTPMMLFVFLLILIQIMIFAMTQHMEGDDAFYIGTAVEAWTHNNMFQVEPYTGTLYTEFPARYVLASFSIFTAAYAKISNMHPTIIAHTVFPCILVPMAYAVYYQLGKHFFKENRKAITLFMFFIGILHSFGYYSVYSISTFLVQRIWQGKAVLANIIIPFLFLLLLKVFKEKGGHSEWILIFITTIAACMVSPMGVALGAITVGCTGAAYTIAERQYKYLFYTGICVLPCVIFGSIYLIIR
jgi:hypothetical protein